MVHNSDYDIPVYSPAARAFHWLTVFLVAIQFPIGLYMTYRAYGLPGVNDKGEPVTGVFAGIADNGLTDTFYSSHKAVGLLILFLVLARFVYRLTHGAPPSDRSVPASLLGVSHATHWLMYLLLITVPIGGYLGISYGGYLDVFGVNLPAVTEKDSKFSEQIFEWHEAGAFTLLALITLHIAATIYHRFVRRDRVVERMLPKKTLV